MKTMARNVPHRKSFSQEGMIMTQRKLRRKLDPPVRGPSPQGVAKGVEETGGGARQRLPPKPADSRDSGGAAPETRLGAAEFRALYLRYRADLIRYIDLRLGGALPEDAAQDVWEIVWRDRDRFDPGRFEAWPLLVGIARHVVYQQGRTTQKLAMAEEEAAEPSEASDELAAAIRVDAAALLARLSSSTRQIILMHFVLGYRLSEIAEALGMSEAAVAKRVTRALKFLRERGGGWAGGTASDPPPSAPTD
jgi:RNA polymerase sigma-70 factor (ECF subfamily)